jgi:hypothetical protein
MTPLLEPMIMPTEGSQDHIGISQSIPPDVVMAIAEGDQQVRHFQLSKMDHSSGLIKLTPRQYQIMRDHIYACHNRR